MNPITPPPLASMPHATKQEPQRATVPVDRACDHCGYNLRGQAANWDRATSRWRSTCPECGALQVVPIETSASTVTTQQRWMALALAVLGVIVLWQLLGWVAAGEAASLGVGAQSPANASALAAARATGRSLPVSVSTPTDWIDVVTMLGTHGIRIALASAGVGMLLALAPYAREGQRALLLVILLAIACAVGTWMYFTGYASTNEDPSQRLMTLIYGLNNGGRTSGTPGLVSDWQWRIAGGIVGFLIAIVGGRIGTALGRPAARMMAAMFVPPEMRPAFLRPPIR